MKVAIYCRVSTDDQELNHQIEACKRFCEYRGFEVSKIYSEKFSGMKAKRPEYLKVIQDLRNYLYDGIVVFRIDRLGRNSHELILLLEEFRNKGIKVFSINENIDDTTPIGKAMLDLICVLAGLEREQISDATKQRLQALKASGKRLGQKPASDYQVRKVRQLHDEGLSLRKIAAQTQLTHVTVFNIVNQKGYYSNHNKSGLSLG